MYYEKLIVLMIPVAATGTFTMNFAADSDRNYKHQNEAIGTNEKSAQQHLSNGLNYKNQKREKSC